MALSGFSESVTSDCAALARRSLGDFPNWEMNSLRRCGTLMPACPAIALSRNGSPSGCRATFCTASSHRGPGEERRRKQSARRRTPSGGVVRTECTSIGRTARRSRRGRLGMCKFPTGSASRTGFGCPTVYRCRSGPRPRWRRRTSAWMLDHCSMRAVPMPNGMSKKCDDRDKAIEDYLLSQVRSEGLL